jgi:hypothetical protein
MAAMPMRDKVCELTSLLARESSEYCLNHSCQTCGGLPFAASVLYVLRGSGYKVDVANFYSESRRLQEILSREETQLQILEALAAIHPSDQQRASMEPAARYLLFKAFLILGSDVLKQAIHSEHWIGAVYRSMEAHYAKRQEAKKRHLNFQRDAQAQSKARTLTRQEKHARRLSVKAERDRLHRVSSMPADE